MRIGINASFIRKSNTGLGQVSWVFLKELINKEKLNPSIGVEFIIYLEEEIELDLPQHFQKVVFRPFWRRDDLVRKIWWEKYSLPRRFKKDNCDCLFSLYQCPTILPKESRHIMLVHDIIPKLFPDYLDNSRKKIYWQLTQKAIQKAGKILAVSHYTEKDLIRHLKIDAKKIAVVYPDCDSIFSQKVEESRAKKVLDKYQLKSGYLLAGGGLEKRKNIENLLLAYRQLLKIEAKEGGFKTPPMAIVGKLMPQLAPLITDAQKIVKEYNLTKKVFLLDFVPQSDLPALYQKALGFVYPSLYEGFGLPVLEAMRSGAPVITSKNSSLPEVGGDGVLYVNANDPQDLVMVMKNLIKNKDLRNQVASRGLIRSGRFSGRQLVEKFLHLAYGKN